MFGAAVGPPPDREPPDLALRLLRLVSPRALACARSSQAEYSSWLQGGRASRRSPPSAPSMGDIREKGHLRAFYVSSGSTVIFIFPPCSASTLHISLPPTLSPKSFTMKLGTEVFRAKVDFTEAFERVVFSVPFSIPSSHPEHDQFLCYCIDRFIISSLLISSQLIYRDLYIIVCRRIVVGGELDCGAVYAR